MVEVSKAKDRRDYSTGMAGLINFVFYRLLRLSGTTLRFYKWWARICYEFWTKYTSPGPMYLFDIGIYDVAGKTVSRAPGEKCNVALPWLAATLKIPEGDNGRMREERDISDWAAALRFTAIPKRALTIFMLYGLQHHQLLMEEARATIEAIMNDGRLVTFEPDSLLHVPVQ